MKSILIVLGLFCFTGTLMAEGPTAPSKPKDKICDGSFYSANGGPYIYWGPEIVNSAIDCMRLIAWNKDKYCKGLDTQSKNFRIGMVAGFTDKEDHQSSFLNSVTLVDQFGFSEKSRQSLTTCPGTDPKEPRLQFVTLPNPKSNDASRYPANVEK